MPGRAPLTYEQLTSRVKKVDDYRKTNPHISVTAASEIRLGNRNAYREAKERLEMAEAQKPADPPSTERGNSGPLPASDAEMVAGVALAQTDELLAENARLRQRVSYLRNRLVDLMMTRPDFYEQVALLAEKNGDMAK